MNIVLGCLMLVGEAASVWDGKVCQAIDSGGTSLGAALISSIRSGDTERRDEIVRSLESDREKALTALPALRAGCLDSDLKVVYWCLHVVRAQELETSIDVKRLTELLKDGSEVDQLAALGVVELLRQDAGWAASTLARLLRELATPYRVRVGAAMALRGLGSRGGPYVGSLLQSAGMRARGLRASRVAVVIESILGEGGGSMCWIGCWTEVVVGESGLERL